MRVQLGGKGEHIPEIALPDPNLDGASVPVARLLEDDEVFVPADYISLGYTHYEVWCIGGAGGRGGDVAEKIQWLRGTHQEHIPNSEWAKVVQDYIDTARRSNVTYYYVMVGYNPDGTMKILTLTPAELAEYQNPTHTATVYDYFNPFPVDSPVVGGGGGGGGLHVVAGRLDELPPAVPVVVGKEGANAPPGQIQVNGAFDAVPTVSIGFDRAPDWYNRYPSPHPLFYPPTAGQDGGKSSFGDVAVASGGKGGGPAVIWSGGKRYFAGHGGDGGSGGRSAAGGGGAGANNPQSTAPGQDGTWDPNTGIGKGGGGGHGGMAGVDYISSGGGVLT